MSSALFAPIFKTGSTVEIPSSGPRKKRKRKQRASSSTSEEASSDSNESLLFSTTSYIKPEQTVQYEIAGQPITRDLPGSNFPHKAFRMSEHGSLDVSEDELATPKHTVLANQEYSDSTRLAGMVSCSTSIRRQHLAVLTAILHRCMMEEDFIRAGRAWGMLLRAELDGHSMDLRAHGRWGLGAEILIFHNGQLANSQAQNFGDLEGSLVNNKAVPMKFSTDDNLSPLFSRDGFLKAKDYYERLILQYPYRKAAPNTVSSIDFYFAMFGLWIFFVQEQGKTKSHSGRAPGRDAEPSTSHRANALEQTVEISARLDELLVSPPYSDNAKLWKLRGMVALWEADLLQLLEHPTPDAASPSNDGSSGRKGLHLLKEKRVTVKTEAEKAFETALRLDKDLIGVTPDDRPR